MKAEGVRKKNEGGKSRRKIKRRAAGHFAANCGRRSRAPSQQRRRRRDASITLNLPSAFSAVCPLSLFVVAVGRYAAEAAAV